LEARADWAKVQTTRRLTGVLAVTALLAAGCGGTTAKVGAGAAGIVPASAPALIAVNVDTDSSQWRTVDELASRFPAKAKAMDMFRHALESEKLDWQRDVKPALGSEVDLVWLDFDNNGADVVALMKPDSEAKFDKLVESASNTSDFFRTKIDGWQVMAPRQDLLDQFRRETTSGGTLADRKAFQQAMGAYPDDFLFRAYVDGAAVMSAAERVREPDFQKLLPKLGTLDWVATNLRVTSDGIRWDANAQGTPGSAFKGMSPSRAFAPTLTSQVPKDALAYFAFHGTREMLRGLEQNPLFGDVPEVRRYRNVFQRIGLLLQGENALYVRPSAAGKWPEVTFVAEPAAGTNGVATLDALLKKYRKQMELPALPKRTKVGGTDARVVKTGGPVDIYYANVGKRLVVSTFPAGIKTLAGHPAPLSQSGEYKGALESAGVPLKTQGFVYVNISGGMGYAQRLARLPIPGEVKRNLRPLRSAVEYAATRPSEIQVTFFLRIK
jgi:hypothetical protein